jgi:hypothetical protein
MAHLLSLSQVLGRYPEALYHQESEPVALPRQTGQQYFHPPPAQV